MSNISNIFIVGFAAILFAAYVAIKTDSALNGFLVFALVSGIGGSYVI